MDLSNKYVLMCEKADEIQNKKPDISDSNCQFFVCEICGGFYTEDEGLNWCRLHVDESSNSIWLPRQDQLQELTCGLTALQTLGDFYKYCTGTHYHIEYTKSKELSMEQLWLAFVMKENFNRIWKGEIWIQNQHQ